ncbi:hypothetical protein Z042_02800 [Chania multitudinisentens RB-25]|uniref:Uncharacterized protein n=1 Tax=Chania multitudinisentens RB-25 TaxID=1441930 RepID=W0LKV0_9GAMM|nr:hypothetical protein [Chania multitudinisentens]AHG22625.1 hypothetical protein Z042_02800 [Chania multitudinisentens RB-25]
MNAVLKKHIFDEVTEPNDLFESTELIAVCHAYYAQFRARHLELRKICVSLYDKTSLALVSHFKHGRYPINDIAFHPKDPLILIGSGSYDGGFLFEGELVLWNYKSNEHLSLLIYGLC